MLEALKPIRSGVSALAVMCAIATAAPALAQSTTDAATRPDDRQTASETPDADIVVTAQRRTERLQDVPIAISAIGSEQLSQRNATDLTGLQGAVPSLQIAGFGGASTSNTIAIRGIAGQQLAIGSGFPTAIYLDGVYLSRPDQGFFGLDDVERIEVLRGPQGALYGRNATAGAVNIITRDPGSDFRAGGELTYGNFNAFTARGSISGPIAGGFSAGLSGSFERHDGYARNLVTGREANNRETYTIRGKLRYVTDDDRFSALLAVDRSHDKAKPGFTNLIDPVTLALRDFGDPNTYLEDAASEDRADRDTTSQGASLTLNFKVSDSLNVVSISAGRYTKILTNYDGDISAASLAAVSALNKVNTFNQELRGVYSGGKFRATVGANVFVENAEFGLSILSATAVPIRANPFDKSNLTAWAVFGQVEYDLSNQFTLVGGLRYNNESRDYSVDYTKAPVPGSLIVDNVRDDTLIPSVGVNFKATRDVLLYAKYSKGYQAPGFTYTPGRTSTGNISFRPESLNAYEVGAKTQFLDRRVTLNAAAFYYDYKDIQIRSSTGVGLSRVTNAASATLKGIEVSTHIVLPAGFSLDAQATYLDGRYKAFCQLISAGDPQAGDPLCAPGIADRSGNRLNLAPKWSGGATLAYKQAVGSAGTLSANVNVGFSDTTYYLSSANEPGTDTRSWTMVGARVGFTIAKGPEIFVYGRNLTDARYAASIQRASAGIVGVAFNDPRTYGVGISYRY